MANRSSQPTDWLYKKNEKEASQVAPHFIVEDHCRLESLNMINMTFGDNHERNNNFLVRLSIWGQVIVCWAMFLHDFFTRDPKSMLRHQTDLQMRQKLFPLN